MVTPFELTELFGSIYIFVSEGLSVRGGSVTELREGSDLEVRVRGGSVTELGEGSVREV